MKKGSCDAQAVENRLKGNGLKKKSDNCGYNCVKEVFVIQQKSNINDMKNITAHCTKTLLCMMILLAYLFNTCEK